MAKIVIVDFTADKIDDVVKFELSLRNEEDFWGWEINQEYITNVKESFENKLFNNALSLLAYVDEKVVGRIDISLLPSHFDGSVKAYLDWICVVKSYRHLGVAQSLMTSLRERLKSMEVHTLIGLMANNDEAQRFYRSLKNAEIKDEGIWIDC